MSMTEKQEHDLLLPDEVCGIFRISPRTLVRWDRDGITRPLRLPNGHRRYRATDIEYMLTVQRVLGAAS